MPRPPWARSGSCEEDEDEEDEDDAAATSKGAAEDHNWSSVGVAISATAAHAGSGEAAAIAEALGEAGAEPKALRDDEHAGCGEAGSDALHKDGKEGRDEVEPCEASADICPYGCLPKRQRLSRPSLLIVSSIYLD
jgi:hypothetical protein